MKKVKWYSLPALPTLLIVIAGTVLLVLSFTRETGAFLRYFSYLLSTYVLHHFGGDDSRFRATMLGVSGFVASIIILSITIYMILHATKKIRRS